MSLFSRFGGGYFNPATGMYEPMPPQGAPQSPQPAPASQPSPQPAGVMSRAAQMQAPAPLQPQQTPALPQGGQPPQLGAAPQLGGSGWGDRLQQTLNAPLFNQGMAMLAAGQPGGGGWGEAQDRMRQIQQHQQAQQMQQRQMRREDEGDAQQREQFGWARGERDQAQERRRLAQEYIASRPPEEQAELRMIDPDALGDYVQKQRQLDLQIEEMRNTNRYRDRSLAMDATRLQQDRLFNSAQGQLGRDEARYIGETRARLDNWRMVDNDIRRIEHWLERRPDVFSSLLDGDQEDVLRRWTRRGDQEGLTAVQELYAIGASMAREELRGQTPVSNIDFLSALRSLPSSASSAGFVRGWIDRAYEDRRDLEGQYQGALGHMQQYGNLYRPDEEGRNFYQGTYTRYGDRERPQERQDERRQAQPSTPTAADLAMLRREDTPARRRQFDEIYGQGAAERALGAQPRSTYGRGRGADRPRRGYGGVQLD